jgi:hypothetical protein
VEDENVKVEEETKREVDVVNDSFVVLSPLLAAFLTPRTRDIVVVFANELSCSRCSAGN